MLIAHTSSWKHDELYGFVVTIVYRGGLTPAVDHPEAETSLPYCLVIIAAVLNQAHWILLYF